MSDTEFAPNSAPETPASPPPEVVATETPVVTETQGGESAPAPKKPSGVQKRLDELTRNWRQTERDRDYWREMAINSRRPEPQATQQEPNPDQYDDPIKLARAQAQWAVREELRRAKEEEAREKQRQKSRELVEKYSDRASKAREKYADFDDLTQDPDLSINESMAEYIRESDEGPEVAYHLARNPEEASRIAQMSDRDAYRALARIEARLTSTSTSAAPKPVTNAPPPPVTVGTASNGPPPGLRDDMPIKDWMKADEQLSKRKKAR